MMVPPVPRPEAPQALPPVHGVLVRQFLAYVLIGGAVFCVDVGLFRAFYTVLPLIAANCAAFLLASAFHFALNKWLNFRNHLRPTHRQALTYSVIVAISFTVSNVVLYTGTHAGLAPIAAKLLGNACNLPIGFLSHRFLTFDRGILSAVRRLRVWAGSPPA